MQSEKARRMGWSDEVDTIYTSALAKLGAMFLPHNPESAMLWGPAHIVWEDGNLDFAQWCIIAFKAEQASNEYTKQELDVVLSSLHELAALPKNKLWKEV